MVMEYVVGKQIKLGEDTVKTCDVPVVACTGPKMVATGCVPDIKSDKKSPRKWVCSKQCKPIMTLRIFL